MKELLLELRMNHIFIRKIIFLKKPIYFRIIADFEADNEIEDNKAVWNKTADIYKQNLVLNV